MRDGDDAWMWVIIFLGGLSTWLIIICLLGGCWDDGKSPWPSPEVPADASMPSDTVVEPEVAGW